MKESNAAPRNEDCFSTPAGISKHRRLITRRGADVANAGSSAGTFSRRTTEVALMALVTRCRGVHHQLVLDVPQAAAVVVGLTKALAQQPYQSRVRSRPPTPTHAGCRSYPGQSPAVHGGSHQ